MPPGVRAGSVVMSDGTIRTAHFMRLNLGFVTFDESDEARRDVAVIILEPLVTAGPRDVIIGRDGSQLTGNISRCSAAACTLDGRTIPRTSTRWIGFDQGGSPPPPSPDADTMFLSSKPPAAARMTAADATTVRSTRGNFPRADVAWVYIADTPEDRSRPDYEIQDDEPESPATTDTAPSQPPAKSTPPAKPPQPKPPKPPSGTAAGGSNCKPGPLWTGMIRVHATGHDERSRADQKQTIQVQLREQICTGYDLKTYKKAGTVSIFNASGSVIEQKYSLIDRDFTCKGSGTATVDEPTSNTGAVYRNNSDAAAPYGFDLPRGPALYVVAVPARPLQKYPVECRFTDGKVSTSDYDISGSPILGRSPLKQATSYEDTQFRFLEGGKMIGSGTAPATGLVHFQKVDFSWSICPADISCPPAPPLPEDTQPPPTRANSDDPCGDLQRYIGALKELADAYKKFERDYKDAVRKRDVVRDEIYGRSGALREFLSSFASVLSDTAGASEPYQKLVKLVNALAGMSGEGNAADIYSAADAFGYGPVDLAQKAAEKTIVRAAVQAANDYLAQTNDHQGALRIYAATLGRSEDVLAQAKGGADKLAFIQDAAEFAEKTSSFADLLQEYSDYNETAVRNQAGMDDINERQNDLQAKIDEARAHCQHGALRTPRWMAASPENAGCCYELVQTKPPASVSDRVKAVTAELASVKPELEAAVPFLLPFVDQVTGGIDRGLLADLANEAAMHLTRVQTNLRDAANQWKAVDRDLPRIVPKETKTTGSGL